MYIVWMAAQLRSMYVREWKVDPIRPSPGVGTAVVIP